MKQRKRCGPLPQVYDMVLQPVGRTPKGTKIAADNAEPMHGKELLAQQLRSSAFNTRELRVLPRGVSSPHAVEFPIR